MTKKIIIGISIVLVLVGVLVGGYFLSNYVNGIERYSEEEYNNAKNQGNAEAEFLISYFEHRMAELEAEIKREAEGMSDLNNAYDSLLDSVREQLEQQGADIDEIAKTKLESLLGMRTSLTSLRDEYSTKLPQFEAELADLQATIEEAEQIGVDTTVLEYAKKSLEKDMDTYRQNISNLEKQIADITDLINRLEVAT